jgi:cell division protease FtsH
MTRKSFSKLERSRAAAIERIYANNVARQFHAVPNIPVVDGLQSRLAWRDLNDFDSGDQEASDKPSAKKASVTAQCAIVAAVFGGATKGAVRRQWKNQDAPAIALVVLVPGPSWIEPVKSAFVARFGEHWYALETHTPKTPQAKAERNKAVADYLACG